LTTIRDQQFVAHVFAATGGPGADAARRAVGEIWQGCGPLFGMDAPIGGTGLPAEFPSAAAVQAALAGGARDGEVALAARERPGAACQAVLRLHHDVLNLSVALAPPEASSASPDGDWPWWRRHDFQWDLLVAPRAGQLLGDTRLFLTQVDAGSAIGAAGPALYARLSALLPDTSADASAGPAAGGTRAGVPFPAGFAVWEAGPVPDDRVTRRLLIPIAPDADAAASTWAWSGSGTAIPSLARYLLHAAKIRYELRVLERDGRVRPLADALDALGDELRRLRAGDPAKQELLRLRRMDAVVLRSELLAMRQTVEIAADNLGRAFDLTGCMIPGGMFADDVALGRWLLERLDDEVRYLAIAVDRAAQLAGLLPSAAAAPPAVSTPATASPAAASGEDRRRSVFVVYGRDDPARRAVFEFLRALGLRPLEWESLVEATGKMAPFLSETVRKGLDMAAAVIVLLTPEDIVRLHPDLHEQNESAAETGPTMQARPNVLLELGMALAAKPEATLVLVVGEQRPVTDLGGMSYVRLSGDPECRSRIADRLRVAGCLVNAIGTDWMKTGDFAGLAAQRRRPE
jgi:predicted nucleotide-binding protein